MNNLTKFIAMPFVALFVYYFCAILWSLIASLALCDFSTFPAMLLFWVKQESTGIIMARISCWFMAFGAGTSVLYME